MKNTAVTRFAGSSLFLAVCAFALGACATSSSSTASSSGAPMAAAKVDFTQKVQPFFATYCFRCHGPNRQSGRTRFDTKTGILARVTVGDPDNSTLVKMITATDDNHMPPATVQEQPSADDIAMIKQWVKQGANIPDSYPSGS